MIWVLVATVVLSGAAVVYSYGLYPMWLAWRCRLISGPTVPQPDEWPRVAVLMAAFNEAAVIERKLRNLLDTDYPAQQIEIWVGTDACSDETDSIISRLAAEDSRIRHVPFAIRTGKPEIINQLAAQVNAPILVLTDAKAFFDRQTLPQLVAPLLMPNVGLVGAGIQNQETVEGIGGQERYYFARESRIKHCQSLLHGTMIGSFGSGYALHRALYRPTPQRFIGDDFYITAQVLLQGHRAILNPEARVFQRTSTDPSDEYRRKRRIATGNYQNLFLLRSLLWSPIPGLSFHYWSHKVLRWLTPFFLMLSLMASVGLLGVLKGHPLGERIVFGLLLLQLLPLMLVLADRLLRLSGGSSAALPGFLRYLSHFYHMNLAMLVGAGLYLRGVKSNTWNPTPRGT
jgi:cellulose synthase/poly-beta-1,6-N-acetylglucosamine synthase-like glycosyltransferase